MVNPNGEKDSNMSKCILIARNTSNSSLTLSFLSFSPRKAKASSPSARNHPSLAIPNPETSLSSNKQHRGKLTLCKHPEISLTMLKHHFIIQIPKHRTTTARASHTQAILSSYWKPQKPSQNIICIFSKTMLQASQEFSLAKLMDSQLPRHKPLMSSHVVEIQRAVGRATGRRTKYSLGLASPSGYFEPCSPLLRNRDLKASFKTEQPLSPAKPSQQKGHHITYFSYINLP